MKLKIYSLLGDWALVFRDGKKIFEGHQSDMDQLYEELLGDLGVDFYWNYDEEELSDYYLNVPRNDRERIETLAQLERIVHDRKTERVEKRIAALEKELGLAGKALSNLESKYGETS